LNPSTNPANIAYTVSTVPLPDQTQTAKLPPGADIPVVGLGGVQLNHWVGRRIGPYRIRKLLGRGGMGAVFLADRDDQEFHKSVALKVLHFDTADPPRWPAFATSARSWPRWITPISPHFTMADPPKTDSLTS
jgi:serine/threonine protein kinase